MNWKALVAAIMSIPLALGIALLLIHVIYKFPQIAATIIGMELIVGLVYLAYTFWEDVLKDR
jgi:hypothetical protein